MSETSAAPIPHSTRKKATRMLTALLVIATTTLAWMTIKSIAYEIRKGHTR